MALAALRLLGRRTLTTRVAPTDAFYLNAQLDDYATRKTTKVTLKQLVDFGSGRMSEVKLITGANFVRHEIAVRLAHRLADFQRLPFIVGTSPLLHDIYQLYWASFQKLRQYPEIKSLKANEDFCAMLRSELGVHNVVLPKLAAGLKRCQELQQITQEDHKDFFDRMLRSRLSRRLLVQQHLALSGNGPISGGFVGVVGTEMTASDFTDLAIRMARDICRHTYGLAPRIVVDGDMHAKLAGVPEHIEYVLYELLKNAQRAVVEHAGYRARPLRAVQKSIRVAKESGFGSDARAPSSWQQHSEEQKLPPIIITVAHSPRDVVFRISDQGNGIAPEDLPQLFHYSFTTASPLDFEQTLPALPDTLAGHEIMPMSGLGCGLPIARVYAGFLGGALELHTMHRYGTDVYYRLKRTAEDQLENLI